MILDALPGFGGSPADYDLLHAALPDTFRLHGHELLAPSPARLEGRILLGYSMGARVALEWALGAASPPLALVLVGATAGIEDPAARATRLRADDDLKEEIRRIGSAAFARRWRTQPIIATQDVMPEPYRGEMWARREAVPEDALVAQLTRLGQGAWAPRWDALPGLKMPVLVVVGEGDTRYLHIGRRLAAQLPRGELALIAGAGHSPHLEAPKAFAATLTRWLRLWLDPLILEV